MSNEPTGETGFLCRHHVELVGDVREIKTRTEAIEKDIAEFRTRLENAVEKASHADGFAQGTIPDLQQRLETAFTELGEAQDTANVYYGQIREMAKEIEKLSIAIDKKADSKVVENKADKGKTEEGIKNCYLWVKVGFVGTSMALLLWILAMLAKSYGLPAP